MNTRLNATMSQVVTDFSERPIKNEYYMMVNKDRSVRVVRVPRVSVTETVLATGESRTINPYIEKGGRLLSFEQVKNWYEKLLGSWEEAKRQETNSVLDAQMNEITTKPRFSRKAKEEN